MSGLIRLFDDPDLCVVKHDFFLSVQIELDGGYGIVGGAFHFNDFAEAKLHMFHSLTGGQAAGVTGFEIRTGRVFHGFLWLWSGRYCG